MPGAFDFTADQSGNGSDNGQGTAAPEDRTATEHSAEERESTEPRDLEEIDLELSDPFPIHALPLILRRQTSAIAELAGSPIQLAAPLILACASASVGRGVRVESYKGLRTRANIYLFCSQKRVGAAARPATTMR